MSRVHPVYRYGGISVLRSCVFLWPCPKEPAHVTYIRPVQSSPYASFLRGKVCQCFVWFPRNQDSPHRHVMVPYIRVPRLNDFLTSRRIFVAVIDKVLEKAASCLMRYEGGRCMVRIVYSILCILCILCTETYICTYG